MTGAVKTDTTNPNETTAKGERWMTSERLFLVRKKTKPSAERVRSLINREEKNIKEGDCSDELFGGPFSQPHRL